MIKRPTAFILGAGTSVPYGFVSVERLLRDVRTLDAPNLAHKLCTERLSGDELALREALQRTHDASLDSLLELRPDITSAGKRLTASMILELEHHSTFSARFPEPQNDWLTCFFGELAAGTNSLQQFVQNPISLITYCRISLFGTG